MAGEKLTPESIRQVAARFLPEGAAPEQLTMIEPIGFSSVQAVGLGPDLTVVSGIASLGHGLNTYLLHFLLPSDNSGTLFKPVGELPTTAILFPTHVFLHTPDGTPTTDSWSIDAFGAQVFQPPPANGPVFVVGVVCQFSTFATTSADTFVLSMGFQVTIGLPPTT